MADSIYSKKTPSASIRDDDTDQALFEGELTWTHDVPGESPSTDENGGVGTGTDETSDPIHDRDASDRPTANKNASSTQHFELGSTPVTAAPYPNGPNGAMGPASSGAGTSPFAMPPNSQMPLAPTGQQAAQAIDEMAADMMRGGPGSVPAVPNGPYGPIPAGPSSNGQMPNQAPNGTYMGPVPPMGPMGQMAPTGQGPLPPNGQMGPMPPMQPMGPAAGQQPAGPNGPYTAGQQPMPVLKPSMPGINPNEPAQPVDNTVRSADFAPEPENQPAPPKPQPANQTMRLVMLLVLVFVVVAVVGVAVLLLPSLLHK